MPFKHGLAAEALSSLEGTFGSLGSQLESIPAAGLRRAWLGSWLVLIDPIIYKKIYIIYTIYYII